MKIIRQLLAALLLLFFVIACNQETKKPDNITAVEKSNQPVQKMTLTDLKEAEKPPPPNQKISAEYQSIKVVEDTEIGLVSQDGIKDEELEPVEEAKQTFNTEDYGNIVENKFLTATKNPLSTFSIDVDEAAYSNVRRYLENGSLPPAGAVRIEEMINYFDYVYPKPQNGEPFTVNTEISDCPWNTQHRLVHIGLQGKEIPVDNLPASNMVFLIDVSGSMGEPNKLPLVQSSLNLLVDQLRENDKVAIVVYAGNAGLVLPSTMGNNKTRIREAINNLQAGGSTAGGEGIKLAYKTAKDNF